MAFTFIDSDAALREHCARWRQRPWLAVDTEFVRVDTYYPILCLVQISDGAQAACIDLLALPDAAPLWDLLAEPRVIKVLHAASQDYEIFVQHSGRCPAPLFDTQIAATLLGIGDQIGYAGLIENMLGITVDKSLSRTDWSKRPLSEAALAYAAADVEHLAEIFPRLQQQLAESGRLGWLAEDCARACDPDHYRTRPQDAWRRLKGLARLPLPAQAVAAALAEWREAEAQTRNRPRKWILEDEPIYRIAERQPADLTALEQLEVMPPKTLARHGATIIERVSAALNGPAPAQVLEPELDAPQKAALLSLQSRVRERAQALRLPPGFLAPKADLIEVVVNGTAADVPLLRGWRRAEAASVLAIELSEQI
jgi:ribonuclease D